jgi:hypothetical protein
MIFEGFGAFLSQLERRQSWGVGHRGHLLISVLVFFWVS